MDRNFIKKNNITKGNFISKIYFNFNYFIVENICNFNNKNVLDFGGGLGFLKKRLIQKGANVKIYDKVKELSDVNNYKDYDCDIVIFSHVLMYINKYEVEKIFSFFKKKNKKILIISCFSNQTIFNKIFAFLLGHKNPHKDTVLLPQTEEQLISNFFKIEKSINFFLFKVILSSTKN